MLADLQQYLFDLADNLAAFMTGGIPAALALVIERLLGRQMSVRTFVIVFLVFGSVVATFVTWQKEHAARVVTEQTRKGRDPAIVRQLQEFYADASAYYNEVLEAKNDKEYDNVEKSLDKWGPKLADWMRTNMGVGASARLLDARNQSSPTFKNVKPDRVETLRMLALMRDNLGKFVESPAWDKP